MLMYFINVVLYLNKVFSFFTPTVLGFVENHVPGHCSGDNTLLRHLLMTKQLILSKGKLGSYAIPCSYVVYKKSLT